MSSNYKPGLGHVGSYQVAGIPFLSGNIQSDTAGGVEIEFPYVTNWITIANYGDEQCYIAFSQNGLSTNYIRAEEKEKPGSHVHLNVKATSIWLSGSDGVDVAAGLTNIETNLLPTNWSGSVGVG